MKPFLNEVTKLEAKKIAQENSDNFLAIVTLLGIFIAGFIAGIVTGSYFWMHNTRQPVIQELCEKQQYDFCEPTKIIYKMKGNS